MRHTLAAGSLLLSLAACDLTLPTRPNQTGTAPAAVATARPAGTAATPAAERAPAFDHDNSLYFERDSSDIDARGRQTLQAHAQRLLAQPRLLVTLTGHSDDQGSHGYNLALAEQRVNATFQALRELGVPARQLRRYAVGQGKAPVACRTDACRRVMRRVDLVYPNREDLPSHRIVVEEDGRGERQ